MADTTDEPTEQADEQNARLDIGSLPEAANDPPTTADGEVDADAIAVEEDFKHKRGDDGEILPVWQTLPGGQKYVLVRPLTQGEANEYLPEDGNILDLDDPQIVTLLDEFYVQPNFDGLDLKDRHIDEHRKGAYSDDNPLDDFGAYGVSPLLMAIANASNFDVFKGMLADNAEMVRAAEEIEGNSTTGN